MTHLSIASWNLQAGGVDNGDDTRLRRQLTLLRSLDLDVLGLQFTDRHARNCAFDLQFSVADMSAARWNGARNLRGRVAADPGGRFWRGSRLRWIAWISQHSLVGRGLR